MDATAQVNQERRTPLEIERRRKDLTRDQLATLAGVNSATIGRIERRDTRPLRATLFVLAVALGVAPSALDEKNGNDDPAQVAEAKTPAEHGPTNAA